jgi:FAD/FMN-containing dehydrogenase
LQAVAQAHGGNAAIFIAPTADSKGATGQFDIKNPAEMAIQQRLKHSLDPKAIFNPQRLFKAF